MKNKLTVFQWGVLFIGILGTLVYFFYFRSLVSQAYENTGPEWLSKFIQAFYPRFFVERLRFDPEFFLKKQILWF